MESFFKSQTVIKQIDHQALEIGPNLVKTTLKLGSGGNARVELVEHHTKLENGGKNIWSTQLSWQADNDEYYMLVWAAPNCREIV